MEQQIIESCVKRRIPLPEKIANSPRLFQGLEPFYIAFWELSTTRSAAFSAGPIPWSAIDRYAEREDLTHDEYLDLVDMVRAMDRTFMEFKAEEAENSRRKAASPAGPISQGRTVKR